MTVKRILLDPARKPIDEIADALVLKVRRLPSGARSLAHVMAIVPTAESGRRLRAAIASRLGAAVPPRVTMPAGLLAVKEEDIATRADEIAAFMEALGKDATVAVAAQYSDIRGILGSNALSFADVAEKAGDIIKSDLADVEVARWKNLASCEKAYLAALAKRGRRDRVEAMKEALANPVLPAGVEEIDLCCVLDPLPAARNALERLDVPCVEFLPAGMERACTPLLSGQILPCATAASEAEAAAAVFRTVGKNEAFPALCMPDAELYPAMQGALQAAGITLQNPARTKLATSSLGHIARQIASLKKTAAYPVFSAFIRGGDARRWLSAELDISPEQYTKALEDLDNAQSKLLPEKMQDIVPKTSGKLRAIGEALAVALRKKGVREILRAMFAGLQLDERDGEAREFAAAAQALNSLLDECFAPGIPDSAAMDIFDLRLEETTYMLESDEGDAVMAEGWLELPFLDADELIVAGFQEGVVPESIVGHPFLPDLLRKGLGLACNESRTVRDRAIMRMALSCRKPGSVRFSFHSIDAAGNILKPSRLLFACEDDAEFVRRVVRLYGTRAGTGGEFTADLPRQWRLALDIPPPYKPLGRTSPSSLDLYLKCPFTYLLSKTFGEKMDDLAEELDASEYGSLVHDALEAWGADEVLRDSTDPGEIAGFLAERIDAALADRFGTQVPAIVALQGESAKRRLADFAERQAERRLDGWRVVATERRLEVGYGHTTIHGRCDRVDFHDATGKWCVIDYKTWDDALRAAPVDAKGVWKSLQLPLYCAMLDADRSPEFAAAKLENIVSCYCVIGANAGNVLFCPPMEAGFVPEAEAKVREIIDSIERGVFWPPSDTAQMWKYDFARWIFGRPEDSVSPEWLEDQISRLSCRPEP